MWIAAASKPLDARTFYVSPTGNDGWSGNLPAMNRAATDGPFASLEGARDHIRRMTSEEKAADGGVRVALRGGLYELAEPLALTAADSGSAGAPITFETYQREKVRLSGGRRVTGFSLVVDPTTLEKLPPEARGRVLQADLRSQGIVDYGKLEPRGFGRDVVPAGMEMFFADRPMTLARWPNEGFVKIAAARAGPQGGVFQYEGDRPRRWLHEPDIWLHGYWFFDWADTYVQVAAIDPVKQLITMRAPHGPYGYRAGQRYYALNLLSELDAPGEWYLDRNGGRLYFWPPSPLADAQVVVSVLPELVHMNDASYVNFVGMTFEAVRGTAITIHGGSNDRIAGCIIRNIGNRAVVLADTDLSGVVDCDIHDTGDGAIAIDGGDRSRLVAGENYAENNHIHRYSRWSRTGQPAVALSGVGNRVSHNLIEDAPHQAISIGGNDHLIEFNEIRHVCLETGDAGAIYMGRDWTYRGNVIRSNFLHHINGPGYLGAMGIYLDDLASGTSIVGNVFYQVTNAVFIGGGRDNDVENNLFVQSKPAVHVDARGLEGMANDVKEGGTLTTRLGKVPYRDPPWSSRYPQLVTILDNEPGAPKGNVIHRNISWEGAWTEIDPKARAFVSIHGNLLDEDPRLKDEAAMNLQLRDGSPAFAIGFKRIPFEEIGLRGDQWRVSPAPTGRARAMPSQ